MTNLVKKNLKELNEKFKEQTKLKNLADKERTDLAEAMDFIESTNYFIEENKESEMLVIHNSDYKYLLGDTRYEALDQVMSELNLKMSVEEIEEKNEWVVKIIST